MYLYIGAAAGRAGRRRRHPPLRHGVYLIYIYIYIHIYIYIYREREREKCIHMYVCVYIYIYTCIMCSLCDTY